jgi:lysophospholipase L1-like esterase
MLNKKSFLLFFAMFLLLLLSVGADAAECIDSLAILADDWLLGGDYSQADMYDDQIIDFKDFSVLASQWPDGCWLTTPLEFKPMERNSDNMETHTGLWCCPIFTSTADLYPINTRLYATKQSVTDQVAMRVDFLAGAKGGFSMEVWDDEFSDVFPIGSAGLTMYAKASTNLTLNINNAHLFAISTDWQKIDIPWSAFGGSPANPDIGGWQFEMWINSPPAQDGWYIIDRIGSETPDFGTNPHITPTTGQDQVINTSHLVGGADILEPTRQRLNLQQHFTIYAFGDSVTAGAQADRGNWWIGSSTAAQYLYFSHLARLLKARYGYTDIDYVQLGYGGWTSGMAKSVVAADLAPALPEDIVIIQFGGNDLAWMTSESQINTWLSNTADLIAEAKTHTNQIIIMSPTLGETNMFDYTEQISVKMQAFAAAHQVAYLDITKWMTYRCQPYTWTPLANHFHPDMMGHIMMAEIMETLFGAPHFNWPEYSQAPGSFLWEGFEFYTGKDTGDNPLWDTWNPAGGTATYYYLSIDYMHSGAKSLRIWYDNSFPPYYCGVSRTFTPQDFTLDGDAESLSLRYRGSPNIDEMYVSLTDNDNDIAIIRYSDVWDTDDLQLEQWQQWIINLQLFVNNNPDFDMDTVKTIELGVGEPVSPSPGVPGGGQVYFDDIELTLP